MNRLLYTAAVTLLTAASALAAPIAVSGDSNVFAAGQPDTTGSGGGSVPPFIAISPGASFVTFPTVTGLTQNGGPFTPAPGVGPDGSSPLASSVTITPTTGSISGITIDRAQFLAGVFVSTAPPTGSPPGTLDFTAAGSPGTEFSTLSPLLNQVFFIGDGLTSTSEQQQFNVPTGATALYFGFVDSMDGTEPGGFSDNSGSLLVDAAITTPAVPEPATLGLLGLLGLGGFAARRFRRSAA